MTKNKPMIAVSVGDSGGVGGEVLLKSWQQLRAKSSRLILLDDPDRVQQLIHFLGLDITISKVSDNNLIADDDKLAVLPLPMKLPLQLGAPKNNDDRKQRAMAAMASLHQAIHLVKKKNLAGLLTLPLDKSIIADHQPHFSGHSGYLAEQDNADDYAMMLVAKMTNNKFFRTVPLTTHVPLKEVPQAITQELLLKKISLVARELSTKFDIAQPNMIVAGLNPHAGDGGIMGDEEIKTMIPAIDHLRQKGFAITGPVPADSLFIPPNLQQYDVFFCPTHDQALIPIKTLFFDRAVNITLGLSYLRVSPDHGTGFDIADKKIANPNSTISAIELVQELYHH